MRVPDHEIEETLEHLGYVQSFLLELERDLDRSTDGSQEDLLRSAVAQAEVVKNNVEELKQMVVNLHNKSIQ